MAIKASHLTPIPTHPAGELMNRPTTTIRHAQASGLTLIELLMALSFMLILSTLGSPVLAEMMHTIRLISTVHELHSAIRQTRNEAIKNNTLMRLQALNGEWKNGWELLDQHGQMIKMHGALHPALIIEARLGKGLPYIAFDGVGHNRRIDADGGVLYGHIRLSIGKQTRVIIINAVGHSRVCNPARDKVCGALSTLYSAGPPW